MNVYLSGMIGAGKTTVGKALAERLGWAFDDLDTAMESMTGKNFRDVVAEEGWLGFRQYEYRICKQFAAMDQTVIGLGGGTVRYEWNRDALTRTGIVVLLVASLDVLANRVRINDRPRVHDGTTLEEDLATIWGTYQDRYLSFAVADYDTGCGKTVAEEVDELLRILDKEGLYAHCLRD